MPENGEDSAAWERKPRAGPDPPERSATPERTDAPSRPRRFGVGMTASKGKSASPGQSGTRWSRKDNPPFRRTPGGRAAAAASPPDQPRKLVMCNAAIPMCRTKTVTCKRWASLCTERPRKHPFAPRLCNGEARLCTAVSGQAVRRGVSCNGSPGLHIRRTLRLPPAVSLHTAIVALHRQSEHLHKLFILLHDGSRQRPCRRELVSFRAAR